jgi:hypothetical protein
MSSMAVKEKSSGIDRQAPSALKVSKREFDAILTRLIATPPKPVTPKRKVRKSRKKPAQ